MKSIDKINYPLAIPIWVSIFLLVTTISLITSACADPETNRDPIANLPQEKEEKSLEPEISQNNSLPTEVFKAIVQQIADNNQVNPKEIEVSKATSKTWPDGCLGLAKADELCTQALVEGWQVKLSDGDRTWVYRTDNLGYNLRLESQSN